MPDLNPFLVKATKIHTDTGSAGTGFFFSHDGSHYLVTAKHIIQGSEENAKAGQLEYTVRPAANTRKRVEISSPEYHTHPSHDLDVVVIPLDIDLSSKASRAFVKEDIIDPEHPGIPSGHNCVIMGYPNLLADSDFQFPLFKRGLLSTPLSIGLRAPIEGPARGYSDDRHPVFLMDADIKEGMSGGPVISEFPPRINAGENVTVEKNMPDLLGIQSESVEELGLHIAVHATSITDIISNI